MDWLNYHHLYYFWTVAREGSVAAACKKLHLAQPTISGQVRLLETALGEKLFKRSGRGLVMTDVGRTVFAYAEEIFALGGEMVDTLKGRPSAGPLRLTVGITDVLPKLIAYRLIEKAYQLEEPVHLVCREGKAEDLIADLSVHRLDLVLTDAPMSPTVRVRAYNHELGECGVTFFATPELASSLTVPFPECLNQAPLLVPTENTSLRRGLHQWFQKEGIMPNIKGEFEDSALLKVFGQSGEGVFPAPTAVSDQVSAQYGVIPIGDVDTIRERFYAVSVERRIKHPAVNAIVDAARADVFGPKA